MSPDNPSRDRIRLYDRQADRYGRLRRKKKHYDHKWRKELLQKAQGQVLELSVGAGANFRFYPKDVHVTGVDISAAMIEKAREAAAAEGIDTRFVCSAAEQLSFAPGSFDTVVSTLSLCAYDDPVAVARLMGSWCRPGGRILLMEHGLGGPKMLQWIQHRLDAFHYCRIGCHANRDILRVVREAPLEVLSVSRKLWGMIYIIEAAKPV